MDLQLDCPSPTTKYMASPTLFKEPMSPLLWYSSSLFLLPTHLFFVISHHVRAFRFLMDSFLRHRVLIPSSHLLPIAKNNSVPAGRYIIWLKRERERAVASLH